MIEFINISKSFADRRVLDDLTFKIPRNKITYIVGKSGEGKSVTIKHIMGLITPDIGRVIVDGHDITKFSQDELRGYRKGFGMLFQHAAIFDSMTVGENVAFPLEEHTKMPLPLILARVEEVLTQTGLPQIQHKYPSELSTGEKKRVGLARALVYRPKIILYDEPTTGMDPIVAQMIDDLIVKIGQEEQELTSVVISHDLKATLETADNIIMLYKGKVQLVGTPSEFRNSKDPIVRQFFSGKVVGPMEFL